MSNNNQNYVFLSTDVFKEVQNQKRLKRLKKLSRAYLSRCKELLNSNKNLSVFFLMLTFRDNDEFLKSKEAVKSAIGRYIWLLKQDIEKVQKKKLYTYFWVLEKQSRGVPHYHVFLVADRDVYIKYPDKSFWHWGFSWLKRVDVSKISKNYLSKYLEKQEQKDFNDLLVFKGLKIYSIYVCPELKESFKDVLIKRYSFFRYRLARFFNSFIKKIKGGYVLPGGELVSLKYLFMFLGGQIYLEFEGIECIIGDKKVYFKDYSDFDNALSFVFS